MWWKKKKMTDCRPRHVVTIVRKTFNRFNDYEYLFILSHASAFTNYHSRILSKRSRQIHSYIQHAGQIAIMISSCNYFKLASIRIYCIINVDGTFLRHFVAIIFVQAYLVETFIEIESSISPQIIWYRKRRYLLRLLIVFQVGR